MPATTFEIYVDRAIRKTYAIPLFGKVVQYPYEKFRRFYVAVRKPPQPGTGANPNGKAFGIAQRKIAALEARVGDFNRFMFEQMLQSKDTAEVELDDIWEIIRTAKKAIFPPMELFGYEKIFQSIIFAGANSEKDYKDADCVVFWGHHVDSVRANMVLNAMIHKIDVILMEDGYLRSVYPNVNKSAPRLLKTSLAYTADYKRYSFDGYGRSTLEDLLNSGRELTREEKARSEKLIGEIIRNRLSKYNHQPIVDNIDIGRDNVKKVLIIDQTVSDWSIRKGVKPSSVFQEMLDAAITENPEADIIIKTHPDMIFKSKQSTKTDQVGHYTFEEIAKARERHRNVYIFDQDVNPVCLLEYVDKVYVFSSHMGFEAMMCGKDVVVFGMPFYAGWGVGDIRCRDKKQFLRRTRSRTVQELFYFAYVLYTKYFHPVRLEFMEIEEAMEFLIEHRQYLAYRNTPTSDMLYPQHQAGEVAIAFAFDAGYYRQATVAMASLLHTAHAETTYSIVCLIATDVTRKMREEITSILEKTGKNFAIQFIDCSVDNDCFEIRGITKVTYFRLLLPELLPATAKIIYADVDIIFREDLSSVFTLDIGNHLMAATIDMSLNSKKRFAQMVNSDPIWQKEFQNRRGAYMHAGFLVMNLDAIRKNGIQKVWQKKLTEKYHFQDMDIINITCRDRIFVLPPYYSHNPADVATRKHEDAITSHMISANDINKYLTDPAVIHFAGVKPWNNATTPKAEVWWDFMQKHTPYGNYFKWRLPQIPWMH